MKKALEGPSQPSVNVSVYISRASGGDVQCAVASGLAYSQLPSQSLSVKTAISRSDVSRLPPKGVLSAATLLPSPITYPSEFPKALDVLVYPHIGRFVFNRHTSQKFQTVEGHPGWPRKRNQLQRQAPQRYSKPRDSRMKLQLLLLQAHLRLNRPTKRRQS